MIYEYEVIATFKEVERRANAQRYTAALSSDGLQNTLNELAARGFRYVGTVNWGPRRDSQVVVMEREGQG